MVITKPSCTNEGQTSSEKPQIHVYKTGNTPGVYVYPVACTKEKNKIHFGETDMFLMQIKRKISVIINAFVHTGNYDHYHGYLFHPVFL